MESQGKPVKVLDEKPDLDSVQAYYLEAFIFLSPMRNSGVGIGAIPISFYSEYYSIFGSPHCLRVFTRIMRNIDGKFVNARHNEETKRKA